MSTHADTHTYMHSYTRAHEHTDTQLTNTHARIHLETET